MRKLIGSNEEKFIDSKFIISIRYWNSSFHVIILKLNKVLPETRVTCQFLLNRIRNLHEEKEVIFVGITLYI